MRVHVSPDVTGESRSAVCERARVWAALLPDGELSVFERRLLDAHCLRCSECRRLRDDVGSITAIVRVTPLDEVLRPVRVPSRRFRTLRPAAGVLASGGAAALAFVLAVWIGPQTRSTRATTEVATAPLIILTPVQSTADSEAIWNLKRVRANTRDPGTDHYTGLVHP